MAVNKIEVLGDLFNEKKLRVPSYQRAYAWEETQLKQFVSDILSIKEKEYYYGHFILEQNSDSFEIIDGQQRITTFILFLMTCRSLGAKGTDKFIRQFQTVSYDQEAFEKIQINIYEDRTILKEEFQTLSIKRILFALDYFNKLFTGSNESELRLDTRKIDEYIGVLVQAHISTHITNNKAVAVQIFELQNTRGVKLNLIEKVKSKLMKTVYLFGQSEENDTLIKKIQDDFADIYRYEETANAHAFRGELTLEDILLHHLRIIDDGTKLEPKDKGLFNSPSKTGNREEAILTYIDKQLFDKQNVVDYITNLVARFKITVELISNYLPKLDEQNRWIGDVFILDKNLSLEFFILLYHKAFQISIESTEVVKLWELLLYTRDFHDKYYRQWYRDDFEGMYAKVTSLTQGNEVENLLKGYIKEGFRKDLMENESLQETVLTYIQNNEKNILNNAFYWWQEKMVYLLYKYEIEQKANLTELRKIMKEGRSIEHTLPQEWKLEWIGEDDSNNLSDKGRTFREETGAIINGIGNLILITGSENSSQSNNHPKTKHYTSCSGGSYDAHNNNKEVWSKHENWNQLILDRGKKLFTFLKLFIR
jgi:uncharacterized protein with ParB-like and HNH nuclease domain